MAMNYREQLLHPNWQKKRLEVMQDAEFKCETCKATDVTLNVHHRRYVKGRMVWEYERNELACLCKDCHVKEHDKRELLDRLLLAHPFALDIALGLLGGFLDAEEDIDESLYREAMDAGDPWIDAGALASILSGCFPDAYFRAAQAAGVFTLNPHQIYAINRWRGFSDKLEASGL